jgi:hypothetical protein
MLDLTGGNLVAYLLRIIRDAVDRNPRFKKTLGEVSYPANTMIRWKDAWIIIKNVASSGNRLSPDYFMCTQLGRAILGKFEDKEGCFIEYLRETDPTLALQDPGVYYINVDYVSEQTRDVGFTVQKYIWREGCIKQAAGSQVFFRQGLIDPTYDSPGIMNNQVVDLTTLTAHDATTGAVVNFNAFNTSYGGFANLLTPCEQLVFNFQNGTPLNPFTDFWYQRPQSMVVCQSTKGGFERELINIPVPYVSVNFTDQTGYQLRPNLDYTFYGGPQWIQLSQTAPPGSTITANMVVKLNPYTTPGTNPENILPTNVGPNQSLAEGQVFIHTPAGDFPNVTPDAQGNVVLPVLLQPGQWCRWEVRILDQRYLAKGRKLELSNFVIVDPNSITYSVPKPTPQNPTPTQKEQDTAGKPLLNNAGQLQYVFPGLWLAIGDQVVVGDQIAVIVSPVTTEVYEIFGSKDNLTITLEVKANDLQTASMLSEMLKEQLLIRRRNYMEQDGITVFEASRDFIGQQRDPSATASTYTFNISVTAMCDWKVYVPLVNRVTQFEITQVEQLPDFAGKLQMVPRVQALGAERFQFVQSYV